MNRFSLRETLELLDGYDSEGTISDEEQFIATKIEIDNLQVVDLNNNVCASNDETLTYSNQNVAYEAQAYHNDMATVNQAEAVIQNVCAEVYSEIENDTVRIDLYDTGTLPASFVEEMEKAGNILEIGSTKETECGSSKDIQKVQSEEESSMCLGSESFAEGACTEKNDGDQEVEPKATRGRKRIKDRNSWQKEVRKRKRQAGEEYISSRGKQFPKKKSKMRKDCKGRCRYTCAKVFNSDDIRRLHTEFWSLTDDQKYIFYAETTTREVKKKKKQDSRRQFSYRYYFCKSKEKVRVCKEFYFGVLCIDDSRVRNYYNKLDKGEVIELRDMRGRSTKSRTPETDINFVIDHISSFNRVPSHYCRSQSTKEYLEGNLCLKQMYEMYCEKCSEEGRNSLTLSMYRHLFKTKFNISFYVPKKDRCDVCEKMKVQDGNEDSSLILQYEKHIEDKHDTKEERDRDRQITDTDFATICFDMENVITLPRADVKNFFYKRKLNVYNLTAHNSIDKSVYNALWTEADAGRGGNEIASALVTILKEIKIDHPDRKSFILWSDSCVPQNKNSIMTFALKRFMLDNDVDIITQKFGCPGHSPIQEVDNAHSSIEKVLKVKEVYSPVSLIRALKTVRRKAPFKIIQLRKNNFFDYQKAIGGYKFNCIPYTKVKCLQYSKEDEMCVNYKLAFKQTEFIEGTVIKTTRNRKAVMSLPMPLPMTKTPTVSIEKKKDLTSMLDYMSVVDRQYYSAMKLISEKGKTDDKEQPRKRQKIQ